MKRILIPDGIVTAGFLLELGACLMEWRRFRRRFPHGLKVTEKNLLKAKGEGFDIYWLMARVLTKAELFRYQREGRERWNTVLDGKPVSTLEELRFKYLSRHIVTKPKKQKRKKQNA